VELAGLEEELADARATLAHHRRRDRHLRSLQDEYAADAASAEAAEHGAEADLRRTEGRIKDVEESLARKRSQVGGVSDSRQLAALESEIQGLAAELDRLETSGLALLDEVGRMDDDAGDARRECDAQETRGSAEMEEMTREVEMAGAAEEEIVQEIDRLIGLLPIREGRHVKRLMAQLPQAVVRVQSGACGGCFGQLPVQKGLDAKQGRALVRCASCTRYVVRKSYK
jgi:predicted  nucleic acid-binding Zn-ribbon protein